MSFNPFAPLFEVPTRLNLPIENHKEFAIISTTGIIGFLAHSIFLLLFWYFDVDFMAYLNIGSILIFAAIYYINRHSVGKSSLLIIIASLEIIVHAIFAVFILGWTSNFHLYLFVPILAAFLVGKVNGISSYILNLFSISVYVFLAVYMNYNNPLRSISEAGMFTFEIMNVINVSSTIIIVTMYYNYVTNEAVKNLAKIK